MYGPQGTLFDSMLHAIWAYVFEAFDWSYEYRQKCSVPEPSFILAFANGKQVMTGILTHLQQ